MKKGLMIVGVIVLVLALLIWKVLANLDTLVAGVIEDVGSDVLKTSVSVSGVSIDLRGGKAGIAGMKVANPEGYSNANLFEMEGIEVDIDLGTIGKDVLVIKSIRVANPKVVFEGDDKGGSNMQTLLDNIDSGSSADAKAGDSDDAAAARMIIEDFEFTGGQVKGSSALKPDEELDFSLPAIKMKDIGRSQGGVTVDVIAKEISKELAGATVKAAARSGLEKVIEKKTKGLLDKLKGKG